MDLLLVQPIGIADDPLFQEVVIGVGLSIEGLLVLDGGHDQRSGLAVQVSLQPLADDVDVSSDIGFVGGLVGDGALAVKDHARSGGPDGPQGMALKLLLGLIVLLEIGDAPEHVGQHPLLDAAAGGLEESESAFD